MVYLPGDEIKILSPTGALDPTVFIVVGRSSSAEKLLKVRYFCSLSASENVTETVQIGEKIIWIDPSRIYQFKAHESSIWSEILTAGNDKRPTSGGQSAGGIQGLPGVAGPPSPCVGHLGPQGPVNPAKPLEHIYAPGNCPACVEWSPEQKNHCIWRLVSREDVSKEITPADPEWADRANKCHVTFARTAAVNTTIKPETTLYDDLKQLGLLDAGKDDPDNLGSTAWHSTEMRLEVHRLKPEELAGHLRDFELPQTIPDIIEEIGKTYGGGKYKIWIKDRNTGKKIKSKVFAISGEALWPEWAEPTDAVKLNFYEFHGAYLQKLEQENDDLLAAGQKSAKQISLLQEENNRLKEMVVQTEFSRKIAKDGLDKALAELRASEAKLKSLNDKLALERALNTELPVVEGGKVWSKSTGLGPYTVIRSDMVQEVKLSDCAKQTPKRVEALLCRNRIGQDKVVPVADATTVPQKWGSFLYFLNLVVYWLSFKRLK